MWIVLAMLRVTESDSDSSRDSDMSIQRAAAAAVAEGRWFRLAGVYSLRLSFHVRCTRMFLRTPRLRILMAMVRWKAMVRWRREVGYATSAAYPTLTPEWDLWAALSGVSQPAAPQR